MKMFVDVGEIYLHREFVDFRKSINGLVVIVEQEMQISPFSEALFVFCNKGRDKLKVVYWDQTGFCLWYKRNRSFYSVILYLLNLPYHSCVNISQEKI